MLVVYVAKLEKLRSKTQLVFKPERAKESPCQADAEIVLADDEQSTCDTDEEQPR
ncbi:MAG: hypothetical protein ACI4MZ_00135 [Christensenellales bacterium]